MAADIDDLQILQKIASQPRSDWDRLFSLLDDLVHEEDRTRWRSPAERDGVVTLGYPVYSECVQEICRLLYQLQVVTPFDWPSWDGRKRYEAGQGLSDAPAADAARLATVILRGERFCDGVIAQAVADGTLVAVLRRLQQWYRLEAVEFDDGQMPDGQQSVDDVR